MYIYIYRIYVWKDIAAHQATSSLKHRDPLLGGVLCRVHEGYAGSRHGGQESPELARNATRESRLDEGPKPWYPAW